MIQRYKSKPVIVEAIQFYFTESCLKELDNWELEYEKYSINKNLPVLRIATISGYKIAMDGDYIIKHDTGKYEVMGTKTFYDTYVRVE